MQRIKTLTMNKDAYYFPHFSNARHDRKVKRIIKELGVEGYGIYFMLLEVLREQTTLQYPMDDIDLLADEFRTSEQKVRTVICNYKLFDVTPDDRFFSPKLIEYLEPYFKMKAQRQLAGQKSAEARQRKALSQTSDEQPTNDRSTTVQQSKVKESKVKESKENKIEERKEKFKQEIANYKDNYSSDILKQFFLYWVEPNKSKTKMRYELEKTWDTNLRLQRWDKNNSKFGKQDSKEKTANAGSLHKL